MDSTNDDEEEESESESDENSMEEECTNEDANMCFMDLEEHEDEVNPQLNRLRSRSTLSSTGRGVKKPYLSSKMVVQPDEELVNPYLNRSRSGQGAVEVQGSPPSIEC
ncbi:hypothetical protein AAG906_014319 [Vitis piasezkii]